MKFLIKASEIHDGLLKINKQRIIYYQKASDKMRELNLKTFFNEALVGGRKKESAQICEMKPILDMGSSSMHSKFYYFRMKVKTIIYNAYELENK